jgi:hypothetical protein
MSKNRLGNATVPLVTAHDFATQGPIHALFVAEANVRYGSECTQTCEAVTMLARYVIDNEVAIIKENEYAIVNPIMWVRVAKDWMTYID